MAFAEKTFYVAVCDGCQTEHEHDEFAAWNDQESAQMAATEHSDWAEQDDGRLLCEECRSKRGGDLWDEEEEAGA